MWFSPHENVARDAEVQFYLAPRGVRAGAADFFGRCPGDHFFVKKRVGAQVRVMAVHRGARSRPKLSLILPVSLPNGPVQLSFPLPGAT